MMRRELCGTSSALLVVVTLALAVGCLVTIDRDRIGEAPGSGASGGSAGAAGNAGSGSIGAFGGSGGDSGVDAEPPPPCEDTDPKNTIVCPGESIQEAVDANTFGAEITIGPGLHRLQTVVPKAGNTFVGQPPWSVLSGAKLLTEFEKDGSLWVAVNQTQENPLLPGGACYTGAGNEAGLFKSWPRCLNPEDLFIDDVPLRHVASKAEVTTGTWFFDYAEDKIYFADDPAGHKVETSETPVAFDALDKGGEKVTIRGLVIEKYAGYGAIEMTNMPDWLIENNEIRLNHSWGINVAVGANIVVRNNNVHNNGMAVNAYQLVGGLIQNNDFVENNATAGGWPGITPTYAHALLLTTPDGTIVELNRARGNGGNGIRVVYADKAYTIRQNRSEQNHYNGIEIHTSCSGLVDDNESWDNGMSGVSLLSAANVEVRLNDLHGNGSGIFSTSHPWANPYQIYLGLSVATSPCGVTTGNDIHDNIVKVDADLGAVFVNLPAPVGTIDRNNYDLVNAPPTPFNIEGQKKSATEWKALYDQNGTFTP